MVQTRRVLSFILYFKPVVFRTMAPESSTQTDPAPAASPAVPPTAQHAPQTYAQQQQQQPGFQQDPRSYGPPYAPYPQQPAQQQWTPPQVPESKAWMITKLTLHGIDIVCCIVGLGLTGALRSTETLGLIALGACPLVRLSQPLD